MMTGMITDRQNTSTTSKVITIFSVMSKSLRTTTDNAVKKSARFLKLTTETNAPSPKAFNGVILSTIEKKRGSSLSSETGLRQLRRASNSSSVPKTINRMGRKRLGSPTLFHVERYPKTTAETPIRVYALVYPNA